MRRILAWHRTNDKPLFPEPMSIQVIYAHMFHRPEYFDRTLQWRHNERDGVSIRQPYDCFLNHLFRRRSKKTSKLRVYGLCAGNSPVTGDRWHRAGDAEKVSIWWRHHGLSKRFYYTTTAINSIIKSNSTCHTKSILDISSLWVMVLELLKIILYWYPWLSARLQ